MGNINTISALYINSVTGRISQVVLDLGNGHDYPIRNMLGGDYETALFDAQSSRVDANSDDEVMDIIYSRKGGEEEKLKPFIWVDKGGNSNIVYGNALIMGIHKSSGRLTKCTLSKEVALTRLKTTF